MSGRSFSKLGLVAALAQASVGALNILYLLYFTFVSYDMDILIKSQVVPTIINPLIRMPIGELGLFRQYCVFLREALGVMSQTISYVSFMMCIDVLAGPALTYLLICGGQRIYSAFSNSKSVRGERGSEPYIGAAASVPRVASVPNR